MMKTYVKYSIIALAGMSAGILLGMYTSSKEREKENVIIVKKTRSSRGEQAPVDCFRSLISFIYYLAREHKTTLSDFQNFFTSHGRLQLDKCEKSDCKLFYPEIELIDFDVIYKIKSKDSYYPYFFVFKDGLFIKFLNPSISDKIFRMYEE